MGSWDTPSRPIEDWLIEDASAFERVLARHEEGLAFGVQLRQLREAAGLSQRAVATHLELSTSFLSDVEKMRRGPLGYSQVMKLLPLLGPTATMLLRFSAEVSVSERAIAKWRES